MKREKMKESLRISGRTVGIMLLVYAIILLLRLRYTGMLILLIGLTVIMQSKQLYTGYRDLQTYKQLLFSILRVGLIVTLIYQLAKLLGPYGFWGTLILILLYSGYKIFTRWADFIEGLRDVEREVWGKPLDRKEWKGRRPPKLKLVWKKGTNNTGEKMKNKKDSLKSKPLPPVVCWISLAALVIIGGLALTDNILTALIAINSGMGVGFFIGYLFGVFIVVILAYLIPIIIIAKYIQHSRRYFKK